MFADWVFDGKSRATNTIPESPCAQLDQIEVPFVVINNTGAWNLHQFGAYDLMEDPGTAEGRKWLIVGPAGYDLPVTGWQLEARAFFDHTSSTVQRMATPSNRASATWRMALRATTTTGLAHSRSRGEAGALPPGIGRSRRRDAPSRPRPARGGKQRLRAVPYGAIVPPGLDEVANPILSFETSIQADTESAGPVTLSLRFSCTEIDSHVIARVGRVDLGGAYHLLSLGSIRPVCRRLDTERSTATEIAIDIEFPEPLIPGSP